MQGLVMFLCVDSIDDGIIANVLDIGDVTNSSSNSILKFFSCIIHAKTKALVPEQTKMSGEGDVPGLKVQDQLVISLFEIKFTKHFCTIEVMYYFIKGRHEVSFSGYCFVSFPHVHAQSYSNTLFGLGHQEHGGYSGGGSISGFNDILLQQGLNTSFKILSLMK